MILVSNRLSAGFFSNLNAVIGWYWYSMITEIPVYIYWNGLVYKNIFDIFFKQKHQYHQHTYMDEGFVQLSPLFTEEVKNEFKSYIGENFFNKYENGWYLCKGQIYSDEEFYKIRQLHNYVYNENLKLNTDIIPKINVPENTLGVNYRFIDMYMNLDEKRTPFKELMSLEEYHKRYLDEIEKEFEEGKYNHIYLASSQKIFFNICLDKFKDKLLYIPMERLNEGLWQQYRQVSLEKEYTDVLSDVLNLSRCKKLLISPSNIAFGLLFLFPEIKFNVFNFLKNTHTQ